MARKKKVQVQEEQKICKKVRIINKNNHPVNLSYAGEGFVLAPYARETLENCDLLGALPKRVYIVKLEK